jgi:hypothetical protein
VTTAEHSHQVLVEQTRKQMAEGRNFTDLALQLTGLTRVEVLHTVESRRELRFKALEALRNSR